MTFALVLLIFAGLFTFNYKADYVKPQFAGDVLNTISINSSDSKAFHKDLKCFYKTSGDFNGEIVSYKNARVVKINKGIVFLQFAKTVLVL